MTTTDEIFISVDIEASGPVPGDFSLLSIGACDAYQPERVFSCLVQPTSDNAIPEALAVGGISIEFARANGVAPPAAMSAFANWIAECSATSTPVFVGLNAAFDWAFINYYFLHFGVKNPFGFAPLDIKALFMGVHGGSWKDTRSSNMKRVTGALSKGTHDALEDARFQAELFRLIRK